MSQKIFQFGPLPMKISGYASSLASWANNLMVFKKSGLGLEKIGGLVT